jgi:GNAT superfamily N-acetyltransferase
MNLRYFITLVETGQPRRIQYAAPEIDGLIDFNAYYFPSDGLATITEIEVDENYRYQGIARRAVEQFEKWCQEHGANRIELDILNSSRGFWLALGYRVGRAGYELSSAKKLLAETAQ